MVIAQFSQQEYLMSQSWFSQRSIEWNHRGITFIDGQTDPTKTGRKIVGHLSLVEGASEPLVGILGHPTRDGYLAICSRWCQAGVLPIGYQGWTSHYEDATEISH